MLNSKCDGDIETLIIAIKFKDEARFEEFYDQFAPCLFGWILKHTIDKKESEELLVKTSLPIGTTLNFTTQVNADI